MSADSSFIVDRVPVPSWLDGLEATEVQNVFGEQAEWGFSIPWTCQALAAPRSNRPMLQAPEPGDDLMPGALAYWSSLLHMLVYGAYVLLIGHVALGALQTERSVLAPVLVCMGAAIVVTLHILAGLREVRKDSGTVPAAEGGALWVDVGLPGDIPDDRARTVCTPGGERIAVFKHNGAITAVTNLCAHQGGPLGEGKVIDGCITCPWHGWQYRPGDGCSPPPFQEKVSTYQVRIVAGRVQVNAGALPAGTATPPARVTEVSHA